MDRITQLLKYATRAELELISEFCKDKLEKFEIAENRMENARNKIIARRYKSVVEIWQEYTGDDRDYIELCEFEKFMKDNTNDPCPNCGSRKRITSPYFPYNTICNECGYRFD
jgi:hypothetical protein